MKKTKQIERIEEMEALFDECQKTQKEFEKSLRKYSRIQKKIDALEEYYFSSKWKKDFADDEEGKLPQDLKRGVLSEDAVYDLLVDNHDLAVRMLKVIAKALENQTL